MLHRSFVIACATAALLWNGNRIFAQEIQPSFAVRNALLLELANSKQCFTSLGEFRVFLEAYSDEFSDAISRDDRSLIDAAISSCESEEKRILHFSFLDDEVVFEQTFRALSFSVPKDKLIDLDQNGLKTKFREFSRNYRSNSIVGLAGQKAALKPITNNLFDRISSKWILEDFCVYCLARHGANELFEHPAIESLVSASVDETARISDKRGQLLIGEFRKFCDVQIASIRNDIDLLLSDEQKTTIERRSGVLFESYFNLWSSDRRDTLFDSFGRPKLRVNAIYEWQHCPTGLHKSIEKEVFNCNLRNTFPQSGDRRFHLIEVEAVEPDRQLSTHYQDCFQAGWSLFNSLAISSDINKMSRNDAPFETDIQTQELEGLLRARTGKFEKATSHEQLNEANNEVYDRLSNILVPGQGSLVYLSNVARNGGLTSFLTRPDVAKELNLSQMNVGTIHQMRAEVKKVWDDYKLRSRTGFVRSVLLEVDPSTGLSAFKLISNNPQFGKLICTTSQKQFFSGPSLYGIYDHSTGSKYLPIPSILYREFWDFLVDSGNALPLSKQ